MAGPRGAATNQWAKVGGWLVPALLVLALFASGCGSEDGAESNASPGTQPDAGSPACSIDADCQVGVCDLASKQCVACVTEDHCELGESCESNSCTPAETCQSNLDCSASDAKVCDTKLGRCVACLAFSDCPPDHECNGSRRCVASPACQNSLECPDGLVCDGARQRCVECVASGDCLPDERCGDNRCRRSCNSDNDCRAYGLLCARSDGYCVECLQHGDCANDRFCERGACRADLCEPGGLRCDGGGVSTCGADGTGYGAPVPCPAGKSCAGTGANVGCIDHTCVPDTTYCEVGGARLMTCGSDGLTPTVAEDCAANGKACIAGQCKTKVCTANEIFCDNTLLSRCNAYGDAATAIQTCDASDQFCDAAAERCSPHVCTPGAAACDANVATRCKADGSGYEPGGTDCSTTAQICYEGTCQTLLCSPSSRFCKNGNGYQCSPDGLSETLVVTCQPSEYCQDGSCPADLCVAGQPTCAGDVATVCKTDGSGGDPTGGTDCAATAQVCSQGACRTPVCSTPSSYTCQNGDVYFCSTDRLSDTLAQDCSDAQFCRPGTSHCLSDVCTPGTPMCVDDIATVCNTEGSGGALPGTDCAATAQLCLTGQCRTLVCTPSAYYCVSGDVHRCSSNGLSSQLYDDCTSNEYCAAGDSSCNPQTCNPNQPACVSNTATACNAEGSGYLPGTNCSATNQVCSQGACVNPVCTPNAFLCEAGDVYRCAASGLSSSRYQDCSDGQYCTVGDSSCNPRVCDAGQPACNGSVIATCNAEGSGYTGPAGNDCAPQHCVAGSCTPTILVEDFEDGDIDGWTIGTGDYFSRDVITAVAANGTGHSFQLGGGLFGDNDGIHRLFPYVTPTSISWWVWPSGITYDDGLIFRAFPSPSPIDELFYHTFRTDNQIQLRHRNGSVSEAWVQYQWYHFEIKNIDWTNRTFDYYVNGVQRGVALSFSGTGTKLGRIDLYHSGSSTSGLYDEIEIR